MEGDCVLREVRVQAEETADDLKKSKTAAP
jgi:hypothetical protein